VAGLSSLDLNSSVVIKGTSSVAIEAKEQAPIMTEIAATNIISPKAFFMMYLSCLKLRVSSSRFSTAPDCKHPG
jgi:hypothetical protein